MANHYEILDIDTDADSATIKAAYRKLSKRYHPDMTGDTKGHFFVMLNDAYETLSNEERRKAYDRELNQNNSDSYSSYEEDDEEDYRPNAPEPGPEYYASAQPQYENRIHPSHVDWNSMEWMKKDFSGIKEKIVYPRPGLLKSIIGGFLYVLLLLSAATVTLVGQIPTGIPIPILPVYLLLIIAGFVMWIKHLKDNAGKIAFIVPHAIYAGWAIYGGIFSSDMYYAKTPGASIIVSVLLAGAVASALWGVKWHQYWQDIRYSRAYGQMTAKNIKDFVSWGTAGSLEDATDKFGETNVALGATGEKMSAEMFERLLRIPGTRIFHGLKFPGSETADVDHAIVNGNKVVLVDSKMWKGGSYRWGYDGLITRNDGSTSVDLHTNFHKAAMGYAREIIDADFEARILIHSNNGKPIKVDNSNAPGKNLGRLPETKMVTAQQFFEEIGNWFAEDNKGIINRGLLQSLIARTKA